MSDHSRLATNRLAGETSPYLLQHKHNPVDWYPWGPEAIERARAEDRPIFLSVGYSACHWCHVMERESFEEPAIAALMNEHFVNVKVDREERPDLDAIYMNAVQAMTGQGGWPMSVFLTPDLQPFYGGTYFPPGERRGMPGFPRVLQSVALAWKERRSEILASAQEMTAQLRGLSEVPASQGELSFGLLDHAFRRLTRSFDPRHGGFGDAPKFPHPMDLKVLMRHHARTGDPHALHMVNLTLDKMARGGIYDHLGGGFARYSTDASWLVPHFEKMLYDNALLISVYVEGYQLTGDSHFAHVARETLNYTLDRMRDPEGAFYSTEDADSEGVEGKFYVWTQAEIRHVLGDERSRAFSYVYDVSEGGNWEGHTILNRPKPLDQAAKLLGQDIDALRDQLAVDRAQLREVRENRIPPGKDTKILVSWNGLMIAAMADASHVLQDPRYHQAAARAASFILKQMRQPDGRLWHGFKDDRANFNAYLDDYACFVDGLTRLFEATGDERWILAATELAEVMIAEFTDADAGGFFYTGRSHETLLTRQKDAHDNATPSGNGMAATALIRLAAITGRADLEEAGRLTLQSILAVLENAPMAAGQSLVALDFLLGGRREVALIEGESPEEFKTALEILAQPFAPHRVVAPGPKGGTHAALPLLADRPPRRGQITAYLCERFTCGEPLVGLEALRQAANGTPARLVGGPPGGLK